MGGGGFLRSGLEVLRVGVRTRGRRSQMERVELRLRDKEVCLLINGVDGSVAECGASVV